MPSVAVFGAGTMGAGIAQIAAASGWTAFLHDVSLEVAEKAVAGIRAQFSRLTEKGKMTADASAAASSRLRAAADLSTVSECDLIVEAIVENFDVKTRLLQQIAGAARPTAILATNTSSLSVTKLAEAVGRPAQLVGMHFFNPVPLLPLVECITGAPESAPAVDRVVAIAREWSKTPVRCRDTPGFIVNRVARGYYLEPLRMLGEGIAGVDELDGCLTRRLGFRMGPFTLMDLIGIDVNYTVSCSVWEQFGRPARLTPHPIQQKLFEAGHFGRKSKRGAYSYASEHPIPAIAVERRSFELPTELYEAVRRVYDGAGGPSASITEQYACTRTLAAIINEAALAVDDDIASPEDIDTAMKLGTNYPAGPLEWAEKIGRRTVRALLDALNAQATDNRFAPAAWLRQ
jgi:3-hydroxybutyryl-CoA dehydrogenase